MSDMPIDQPEDAEVATEEDAEDRIALADSRERGAFVLWETVKADLGLGCEASAEAWP